LLQAVNLARVFGDFQALYPVDFQIEKGEIILLTGPNGAGKTTLLHCLAGLLKPTQGNIYIEGYDLYHDEVNAKQRLAFVPDVPRFYPELTVWEHLRFISLAFGVEQGWEARAESILKDFRLLESSDLYPHNLSRGMRLKLGILLALIRPFKVLLLDEPDSALDTESVSLLSEILLHIQAEGGAILLTSHNLSMVEAFSCRSWRMDRGQLVTD
jgi:ABC-2 type transport system ATP-binding protein